MTPMIDVANGRGVPPSSFIFFDSILKKIQLSEICDPYKIHQTSRCCAQKERQLRPGLLANNQANARLSANRASRCQEGRSSWKPEDAVVLRS